MKKSIMHIHSIAGIIELLQQLPADTGLVEFSMEITGPAEFVARPVSPRSELVTASTPRRMNITLDLLDITHFRRTIERHA
jgi:hypothetical protein